MILPDQPTGQQLVDVIHDLARLSNSRPVDVAKQLTQNPWLWLKEVAVAKRPTPRTIERVRALLERHPATAKLEAAARPAPVAPPALIQPANSPTPPKPAIIVEPSPRSAIGVAVAVDTDPRPMAASREACPRCATRGDLGCVHQRPFLESHEP